MFRITQYMKELLEPTPLGPLAPGFSHIPAPNPYRYAGDIRPGETVGHGGALQR